MLARFFVQLDDFDTLAVMILELRISRSFQDPVSENPAQSRS